MGKLYRFLSVGLCAVLGVLLAACQPVLAVGEETAGNDYNKYGKVRGDYGNFICTKIDDNTSRIYLTPVFVNTSTQYIKRATITVEFVNVAEFPKSGYYQPVATTTAVVENIRAGREKRFEIKADIAVEDADDRLDILESTDTLAAYFHKIEWEISDARPGIDDIKSDPNFV